MYGDGGFLLTLILGLLTSVFSFAAIVERVLSDYPLILWSAFFGLIFASGFLLILRLRIFNVVRVLLLIIGLLFAGSISLGPGFSLVGGGEIIFLSGFVAIIAMILPGISGSFILVLIGMYPSLLNAITTLDLYFLSLFFFGAILGLIVFSRLLNILLTHAHEATMSVLSGFLLGSLPAVWPWRENVIIGSSEHAEIVSSQWLPILPSDYAVNFGQDPQVGLCFSIMLLGFISVCGLEFFARKNKL